MEKDISRYPEAGWVFAPRAHGKGYAGEALGAILTWLKEVRGISECVCIIAPENKPSIRLAERHGFRLRDTLTMNHKSVIFYHLTLDWPGRIYLCQINKPVNNFPVKPPYFRQFGICYLSVAI